MKTLEHQTKPKKMMGRFATLKEVAQFKTDIANEMLSKVKNLDEFVKTNDIKK